MTTEVDIRDLPAALLKFSDDLELDGFGPEQVTLLRRAAIMLSFQRKLMIEQAAIIARLDRAVDVFAD